MPSDTLSAKDALERLERDIATLAAEKDFAFQQVDELEANIARLREKENVASTKLAAFDQITRCLLFDYPFGTMTPQQQVDAIKDVVKAAHTVIGNSDPDAESVNTQSGGAT